MACILSLLVSGGCTTFLPEKEIKIEELDSYYLCFPETLKEYRNLKLEKKSLLIKKILIEKNARNINCKETFSDLKTPEEELDEFNEREMKRKAGICRRKDCRLWWEK